MKNFDEIEQHALERNIPVMQKEGILFLIEKLTEIHAKSCLEIGTAFGFSAAVIGILGGVEVTTLEKDAIRNMKANSYF